MKWADRAEIVRQFRSLLEERRNGLVAIPKRAVRRATYAMLAIAMRLTPKRTGTLVRSEAAVVRTQQGVTEGVIGTPMVYAPYMEYGTGEFGPKGRPFEVKLRSAKALYWGAADAEGNPVFARRTVVRGAKPQRMFAGALEEVTPKFLEWVRQELAREAAR